MRASYSVAGSSRVDHIFKKCFIIISTPLIPLQYIRRDTKKNFSSIGEDLGVPQAPSFFKGSHQSKMHVK